MSEAQQCDELTHAMERMRTDVERGFSTLLPLVSSTDVTCIRGNLQHVRSAVSNSNGVTITGDCATFVRELGFSGAEVDQLVRLDSLKTGLDRSTQLRRVGLITTHSIMRF